MDLLFNVEQSSELSLQRQIKTKIIDLIQNDQIGDTSLPSSRKLASQLGVSRNTVTLAYENLVEDGYLIARERSGYFINPDITNTETLYPIKEPKIEELNHIAPNWEKIILSKPADFDQIKKSNNWADYDYPFMYGQIDPTEFPIDQWRDCNRWVQTKGSLKTWVVENFDGDDQELVKNIRQQILTARGIDAEPEEILITLGTQNSMFMLSQLLIKKKTTVGVENPGYIDFRNILKHAGASLIPIETDHNGIIHSKQLSQCDYISVTPSHQYPTTVTMPVDQRKSLLARAIRDNFIIIEDDYESEVNFLEKPLPALKSMDSYGRVIYLGSLSKSISPGLRIGYIVADKNLIHQLKAIRRLNYRHPPSNNLRAMSLFIAQGYYASHVRRMRQIYAAKWQQMSNSIAKYLSNCTVTQTKGSFCFWIALPKGVNSKQLIEKSKTLGILVQSGDNFFVEQSPDDYAKSYIRLGFSAIAINKIDLGLKLLGQTIDTMAIEKS